MVELTYLAAGSENGGATLRRRHFELMLRDVLLRRLKSLGDDAVARQDALDVATGEHRLGGAPEEEVVEDDHRVLFDVLELGVLRHVFEFAVVDDVALRNEDSVEAATEYLDERQGGYQNTPK